MASATQATSNHIQSFFEQYPRFNYDPTRETMVQFRSMCRLYGWCHDSEERKQALEGVRDAIALQFNAFYGSGANSLNGWHSLYRALRVQDIPDTVKGCKEGIKTIHVNICDLVDHKEDVPTKHPSEAALAQYSRNSGKIYPRENAYAGGLLRFLLRQIYGEYHGRRREGVQRRGVQGQGSGHRKEGGSNRQRRD
ncbi:hypothetical protein C8R41DRAFT_763492 [Lentinula lateritia]|uniref:Uncharacterized protein n=1 Tax=Lentinula lateritia TaxID=40482 RepID=A0ABQ8VHJ3_9AGAR|nr:hypothetical protein C8R41DRAFT_763492 [Lentinula lateritia]